MNKDILKKKTEGVMKKEASEADFSKENKEKALKQLQEEVEKDKIKRFSDLKNRARAILAKIAKEEDINYYN